MAYQFANRCTSTLTKAAATGDTVLRINVADANRFPVPSVANPMQLTIVDANGVHEIVTCTQRIGEDLTVVRGQEGTPAASFAIGSRVELRLTAAVLRSFMTTAGGTFTGDIDMDYHEIREAKLWGAIAYTGLNVPILAPLDENLTRAIQLPNAGAQPKVGSFDIISADFLHLLVFAAWMQPENIPWYLKICDGTNGTPDLRNRFILGTPQAVGGTGATGGSFNGITNIGGEHNHSGATGLTYLQNGNLPNINQAGYTEVFVQPAGGQAGAVKAIRSPLNFPIPGQEYANTAPHQHGIPGSGQHNHDFIFAPPYCTLVYVMFRYTYAGAT